MSHRYLFVDEAHVERTENVKRTPHQPAKFGGNPVMRPTGPHEAEVCLLFGTVIFDEEAGHFKMWYHCGGGVAYATSDDGIEWEKPRLDVTERNGQATNIVFSRDQDPDPSRRYKMIYVLINRDAERPGDHPLHPGQFRCIQTATSPDGIHWQVREGHALPCFGDISRLLYDPYGKRYVVNGRGKWLAPFVETWQHKCEWLKKRFWGRVVEHSASEDFVHWSRPIRTFSYDELDPPGTEIYSLCAFPYEGLFIGLNQVYRIQPDDPLLDIQLVASRDGFAWAHVADRAVFLPNGEIGTWDRFNQSTANAPVLVGDELCFYYGGRTGRHSPYDGPDAGPRTCCVGLAKLRRDGFVSLDASFDGGTVRTKAIECGGEELHVNAKCDWGEVRARVLDEAGQPLDGFESAPLSEDAVDMQFAWPEGARLGDLRGRKIRLELTLRNAQLYSFWWA